MPNSTPPLSRESSRTGRPVRSRRGAFPLVEVMAAAFVMALAISTSVTTLQVGFRSIDTARNLTLAGQILQSMIEDIRLKQWTTIDAMPVMPSYTTGPISTFDTTGSFTNFSTTAAAMLNRFTITRQVTLVDTGLKKIVLIAQWTGVDGRTSSVNYTTYYAQNGLYDYYYP
jgi:Tfp pilus assembly protein PilV